MRKSIEPNQLLSGSAIATVFDGVESSTTNFVHLTPFVPAASSASYIYVPATTSAFPLTALVSFPYMSVSVMSAVAETPPFVTLKFTA